ncbi:MAG: DUF421 domain-containing protein [Oscillospiraceae bacterium]|nr:DUF421 domain-containing protein [Oscillospiraceae bacterium]
MIIAFFRTALLYFLIMAALRLMGKRQLGELEPAELVIALLISDLAAVPMQDFGIPLLNGIIPILTLLALSMLVSYGSLKSIRFRKFFCGVPSLLIRDGVVLQKEMQKNRFTTDELIEELRTQGISDLESVKYAILETNGQLSVLLRSDCQPLTAKQAGLRVEDDTFLPIVIISDGRLIRQNLDISGHTDSWVERELKKHGAASHRDVFLLMVDERGKTVFLKKEAQ